MAGQRKSVLLRVVFNGEPFMNEVINYKSSRPKKKMESVKGGTYVEGSTSVGVEAMKASVTIKGTTTSVLRNYGLHNGNKLPVTVKEFLEDEDGQGFQVIEEWLGEIESIEDSEGAQGSLPQHTINLTLDNSKRTVNGEIEWEVKRRAAYVDLGQGNILERAAAAVGA
ncbi:TPA: phage major tail tube protein [Aeromonas hydrophila]